MSQNSSVKKIVAYFSMEIYLSDLLANYAGGLGVLAGDILRAAADQDYSLVGMTLLNSQGYLEQQINEQGEQTESPATLDRRLLKKLPTEISVLVGSDEVRVGVWEFMVKGVRGTSAPSYLLDTDLPVNKEEHRQLTKRLYGGDQERRLKQAIILGRGGVKMLQALGYEVKKYHLNEGHCAFAALALFNNSQAKSNEQKVAELKAQCLFTTHTSVKDAQNEFSQTEIRSQIPDFPVHLPGLIKNNRLSLTEMALYFSAYVNAVSLSHQRVVAKIFPNREINYITNGVHSLTWTAPEFQTLYDKYLPGWRENNNYLEKAEQIPVAEIWAAHQKTKARLLEYVKIKTGLSWSPDVLTIVFARRMAAYKRPELLLFDLERLLKIQATHGKMQIIFAGKAHSQDESGRKFIRDIYEIKNKYAGRLDLCFLENYEAPLAKLLVAGADLWLNTPLVGNEASGTSGMKAAHNGVMQISTLDGWWEEGYVPEKTGWLISSDAESKESINQADATNLYDVLENSVLPAYYHEPKKWQTMMRLTIARNASRFNTERVLRQYKAVYDAE